MKNNLLFLSVLAFGISVSALCAKEIDTNTAKLQAMNKLTGKVSVLEAPVNAEVKFGSFSIVVRACKTRPPEETPDNFAFVDVVDIHEDGSEANIFKGWMISSSPALHAIAHPIYDVWLLQCVDTDVESAHLLSAEELADRDEIVLAEQLQEQSNLLSENAEIVSVADETISQDASEVLENNAAEQENFSAEVSSQEKSLNVELPTRRKIDSSIYESEGVYVESASSDVQTFDKNSNLVVFTTEPAKSENESSGNPESLIKQDSSDAVLLNNNSENTSFFDNAVSVILPESEIKKQEESSNDDATNNEGIEAETSEEEIDGQPDQLIMFNDDFESLVPQSL